MLIIFSNSENMCDLSDVPASINDINRGPTFFTLSTTIYELSSSRNLFSKAKMRQFGASRADGLISKNFGKMFFVVF